MKGTERKQKVTIEVLYFIPLITYHLSTNILEETLHIHWPRFC